MGHMGRVLGFASMMIVFLASFAPEAEAQKKKKGKVKQADIDIIATPEDYKKIEKWTEMNGKIVSITGNTVTMRVDFPSFEPNPKYKPPKVTNPKQKGYNAQANQQAQMWRTYQNIQRQQQLAMTASTPQKRFQAMQRYYQDLARFQQQYQQQYNRIMQQYNQAVQKGEKTTATKAGNEPFIVVTTTKEYELDMEEKVEFRKLFLPFEYDDAGNVRKYTEKEKKELRGEDKKKPGYIAKIEEATPGTEAKLSLTPPPKKKKDAKEKDKEDDDMAGIIVRPTIRRVLLTKEAPPESSSEPEKKRKKKKN